MEPKQIEEIRNNKLFQNIDIDSLLLQSIAGNKCILNYGELLYRAGELNTSLFLVVKGEINLIPSQFTSANNSIIFSENDFFGVNEFISGMARSESAIALRDAYLIELSKEEVKELIKQSDIILTNIYSAPGQNEESFSLHFDDAKTPIIDDEFVNDKTETIPDNEIAFDVPEQVVEEEKPLPSVSEEVIPEIKNDTVERELVSPQSSIEMTFEQLDRINKAAHLVNSNVKIDDVLRNIVDVSVSLCEADRGTLYLVDRSKNELWSKVLQGNEPRKITLKIGDGFAGWSAANKEIVNVEDAYSDDRFNNAFDKSSGYRTKSILCFPIKNKNDDVLGVIQLLNSKKDTFTKLDENFLNALSTHAALALQNADLVEQLLKSERISSLGKMANFLIQDIKKPILVSKRYSEHLLKKELSDDVVQVVNMLLEQLNNIADLVQSTSNYSDGESVLRSSKVSFNEAVSEFITRIDSYVQSMNCEIIEKLDSDVTVEIDTKEFFQGFKHIIKNACEAMPDGGDINITTSVEQNKIKLIVKDNGQGIPTGFNEKIFEPFMSYGKKTGTGLGLSVTRKIVEEHGGTITGNSELGTGSTFIITLPIAE
jgi:nitrogen-specific signal transduction histidine kinase